MNATRTPDPTRGDVPGLLLMGTPVLDEDGSQAVIVDGSGEPGDERWTLDWTTPLARYSAALWLIRKGHDCFWMLPRGEGGTVEAVGDLDAATVSAILLSRSVTRVGRGLGAVRALRGAWVTWDNATTQRGVVVFALDYRKPFMCETSGYPATSRWGWWYGHERGPETGPLGREKADAAALADGCALVVEGGLLLPEGA